MVYLPAVGNPCLIFANPAYLWYDNGGYDNNNRPTKRRQTVFLLKMLGYAAVGSINEPESFKHWQ